MIELDPIVLFGVLLAALAPVYALLWKMLQEMTELRTVVQLCPYCQERRKEGGKHGSI